MTILDEGPTTATAGGRDPGDPAHDRNAAPGAEGADASTLKRLARFGLWQLLAMGTTKASALLVSIVVARKLGPDAFGRYSYYSYLLNILPALFALGIPGAIAKLVAERLGGGDDAAARALYRLGLRAHVLLLPVPVVACALIAMHGDHHALLAVTLAVGVSVSVIALDLEGLLTATRQFHILGLVATLGATSQLVLAVVCAFLHTTWVMFVVVQATATCVGVSVYLVYAARQLRGTRVAVVPVDRRTFVRFAAVMTFAVVLNEVIFGRPELLFLARYRSNTTVALYAVALRAAGLASLLPQVTAAALLPEFARLRGANDHDELADTFTRMCRLLVVVAAPIALGGAAVAHALTVTLYGSRYSGAALATSILLAASFVNSLSSLATAIVLTGPRPRLVAELGAVTAVFNITADFVLIPRYGLIAAASINVAVQVVSVVVGMAYAQMKLNLHVPIRAIARIVAIALGAASVAATITHLLTGIPGLLLAVTAGGATYLGLIFTTKTVAVAEVRALLPRTRTPQ